jgi:predicted acylesterase/phospholipase RssA
MTGDGRKVALILSGGGANGAYEVGVLKALLSGRCASTGYQPLVPDIVTGTSAGALNAAFLVSRWEQYGPAAAGELERFWLDQLAGGPRGNGVYRVRANPFQLLDPGSYLPNPLPALTRFLKDAAFLTWDGIQQAVALAATEPGAWPEQWLLSLLDPSQLLSLDPFERTVRSIDYQAIQGSRLFLKIAAVNWATGALRVFWNHDMTEDFGPVALRAAIALPGLLPPVEYGAQPYVDGSVLLNTPLSLGIHAGAEILHVVYLDPDLSNIPLAGRAETLERIYRIFQIVWAAKYDDDIGDAARINRGIASRERLARLLDPGGPEAGLIAEALELEPAGDGGPLRQLTIHRYHPHDPLPGRLGFLNFEHDRVASLIERGFQDAVHHDDDAAGDVVPVGDDGGRGRAGHG